MYDLSNITNRVAKSYVNRLDTWMMSLWITIDNVWKYRLVIKNLTPDFKFEKNSEWYSIKWNSNTIYTIYPKRWRNAKKPIWILHM